MFDVTLAVLAGGQGSRMGRPKAELTIAGQPILEYLLDRFAWDGPTLLITSPGREHPQGAKRFGREAIDPVPGEGPLRGLLTALENTTTAMAVVVTVDMPGVIKEQLIWLTDQLGSQPDMLGIMCSRRWPLNRPATNAATNEVQIEPFPCALRTSALDAVRECFACSRQGVHALRHLPHFLTVTAPQHWSDDVWVNLNSPVDLHTYRLSAVQLP